MKRINENIILDEWFYTWIDEYKKRITEKTRIGYIVVYNYISNVIGDRKVVDIQTEDFYDIFNDMVEFGHSKSTIKQAKMVIKQSLDAAVENGLIEKNPVPKKYVVYGSEVKKSVLTHEEQSALLEYVKTTEIEILVLIVFLITTGLRSAEARALTWDDIDLNTGYLKVNKSLREYYIDGKRVNEVNCPKTKKSNRTVPLNKITIAYLRKYLGEQGDLTSDTYDSMGI